VSHDSAGQDSVSQDSVTLIASADVPDGEALCPKNADGTGPAALPAQVIFRGSGGQRLMARTRPVPPNQGGMVQVSQQSLTALGGAGQLSVTWTPARFRDLLRYSPESRRTGTGVLLAAVSSLLAAAVAVVGGVSQKAFWLVALFLVSALATLGKELTDAWQDFQSVRG
jgi:hypothetical protein